MCLGQGPCDMNGWEGTEMTREMREQQLVKETQRGMGRRRSVRSTHALMPVVQSEGKAKRGEVET